MNTSECENIVCNIYDDSAYVTSYIIVILYAIFTLYLLYGSVKFKTIVTIGLYGSTLSRVQASSACFFINGCYFKKYYTPYELCFQYLLFFFAIVNIIITIARFNALHRYGPKTRDIAPRLDIGDLRTTAI